MLGIARGIRKSQERARDIKAAKHDQDQKDKEFDQDSKLANLKIDKLERMGEFDKLTADIMRERQKGTKKEYGLKAEAINSQTAAAEATVNQELKQGAKAMKFMARQPDYEASYSTGSGFKLKPRETVVKKKRKLDTYDKALGELQSNEYSSRREAEAEASRLIGSKWRDDPEAVKIVDSQFPGGKYKLGEIRDVTGKGKWKYLGDNNWEQAE